MHLEERTTLRRQLAEARARSDELFGLLCPGAFYERPIPERHRIIFYLGHLEAFDWNLVCRWASQVESFHQQFDRLFDFGIDPVDGNLPSDKPSDWPSIEEICRYNQRVRQEVDQVLDAAFSADSPKTKAQGDAIFHYAIEHRLMHAETLAYMLHQLPLDKKISPPIVPEPPASPVQPHTVEIPSGRATLGLARSDNTFGWDNEFEAQTVGVPGFALDAYNVTNSQYLEFLRAGGYQDRNLWSESDWNWNTRMNVSHPGFWRRSSDRWHYRTMFEEIPLPLDWPVYVSHAEAAAYARWVGKALPTEKQLHRAAYGTPEGRERSYPWGSEPPDASRGNYGFCRWDPTPVGAHPAGNSAFGVADLIGNGWEWTSTLFEPFPGFQPFSFYPGYSANFFDGKHYVIKGGSARTAPRVLRGSFRNWFQPHYPYAYAAFRCVEN